MSTMRAVVVAPGRPGNLALGEVAAPEPHHDEVLVRVEALSLNLGEVRRASQEAAGMRIGWDLAGTVVAAAANGKGPRAGARVVGLIERGAWAEQVAVPYRQVAELPAGVTMSAAATLPVAGLTALYALEHRGGLIGRRVLVTGASGGVGLFACRLSRLSGASVVALIRQPRLADLVRSAGAQEVVVGETGSVAATHGPYDLVLDSVGGSVLGEALGLLARDSLCVSYGVSAGSAATFDARAFFRSGRPALYGLYLFEEFARWPAYDGLRRLAALVADGRLVPHIDVETGWQEVGAVAQRLLDRKITGKAVLRVGP